MPKLTAVWGKTGEKWLPKGCFQGIERPHLWEKCFQGLQNVKNYREKAEKTAEIPKYYALFALMWEKYEKSHEKSVCSIFIHFSVRRAPVHGKTYERQEPEGRTPFFKISFSS